MNQNFINTLRDYTQDAKTAESLGSAMLQCSGMFVPEGAPEIALLITNFPRPMITHNEPADFNLAGGGQFHVSGAPKNRYDGSFQMIETDFGQATAFAELLMSCGGSMNCTVYDGRPDRFIRAHELLNVSFTFEPFEIDSEGVSTIQRVSGQVKYNYYGVNASLGQASSNGMINGINDGSRVLYERANKILDAVYAGNTLVNAIREFF